MSGSGRRRPVERGGASVGASTTSPLPANVSDEDSVRGVGTVGFSGAGSALLVSVPLDPAPFALSLRGFVDLRSRLGESGRSRRESDRRSRRLRVSSPRVLGASSPIVVICSRRRREVPVAQPLRPRVVIAAPPPLPGGGGGVLPPGAGPLFLRFHGRCFLPGGALGVLVFGGVFLPVAAARGTVVPAAPGRRLVDVPLPQPVRPLRPPGLVLPLGDPFGAPPLLLGELGLLELLWFHGRLRVPVAEEFLPPAGPPPGAAPRLVREEGEPLVLVGPPPVGDLPRPNGRRLVEAPPPPPPPGALPPGALPLGALPPGAPLAEPAGRRPNGRRLVEPAPAVLGPPFGAPFALAPAAALRPPLNGMRLEPPVPPPPPSAALRPPNGLPPPNGRRLVEPPVPVGLPALPREPVAALRRRRFRPRRGVRAGVLADVPSGVRRPALRRRVT